MEVKRATILTFLFALMLLFTSEVAVHRVEGKICRYPSKKFHWLCFSDRHCANVCQREGFLSGDCEGVRRRCLCHKACT